VRIELKENIENLYEVFKQYKGNPSMEGSPVYGHINEWSQELFSKPLRSLSDNDLSRFTGKVMTTWGEVEDLKHFIPRMLELTALYIPPYEVWIIFDKLTLANWKDWPLNEKQAIEEFMYELWRSLLHDESNNAQYNFLDYFSTLAHFVTDFDKLLSIWLDNTETTATKHLSTLIIEESYHLFHEGIIRGFQDKTNNATALKNWLLTDEILDRLSATFFANEKSDYIHKYSEAEKIISDHLKLK
jgi:hypothetical protein